MCIEIAIIKWFFLCTVLWKSIELIKTKRANLNELDRQQFEYGTSDSMNEWMNDSFIGNLIPRLYHVFGGTCLVYDDAFDLFCRIS